MSPSNTYLDTVPETGPLRTPSFVERSGNATYGQEGSNTIFQISPLESKNRDAIFRNGTGHYTIKTSPQPASMHLHPCDVKVKIGDEAINENVQPPSCYGVGKHPQYDRITRKDQRIRLVDTSSSPSPRCVPSSPELDAIAGRLSAHLDHDDDDSEFLSDILSAADDSDRQSILDVIRGEEEDVNRYRITFTPSAEYQHLFTRKETILGLPRDEINSVSEVLDADYHDEEEGFAYDEEAGYVDSQNRFDMEPQSSNQSLPKNEQTSLVRHRDVLIRLASTRFSFGDVILALTIIFLVVLVWTGRSDRVLGSIQASTKRWLDYCLGYTDLQTAVHHAHSKVGVSHISTFLNVKLNSVGVWLGV